MATQILQFLNVLFQPGDYKMSLVRCKGGKNEPSGTEQNLTDERCEDTDADECPVDPH